MDKNSNKYKSYTKILHDELVPAMGCTEPIALALCSAITKKVLNHIPTKIDIYVSSNIVKNVKSVTVPNTGGMHGIEAACGIGIIAGDPYKLLEVISEVSNDKINELKSYLEKEPIKVHNANNSHTLYIEVHAYYQDEVAKAIIEDAHTHVVKVLRNNEVLYSDESKIIKKPVNDYSILNIDDIISYANSVDIDDIKDVIGRQIDYNYKISLEGLESNYGANIGKTLYKYGSKSILEYVKALSAAGSDARMNGCDLPVIINSGSGNQGLTCSVPVIGYAKEKHIDDVKLYRALVLSNLCTTHIKASIGKLSAYCGVVIAGACSGAGIAYLEDASNLEIKNTIVNALAMASGIVCDGAKPSCAGKISLSVEAGLLGYYMAKDNNNFINGDGIVKDGIEDTIKAIGHLARDGMKETDKEIIHIMIDECNY